MNIDAEVLRALLRLGRQRLLPASPAQVALRTGADERKLQASLRRLVAYGLVDRTGPSRLRLTMTGLALAVAMLPPPRGARPQRWAYRSSCAA